MKDDHIVAKIKQKKLVFTVTTGRSGTAYLASIFGFAKNVFAVHEPSPEFADVFRMAQEDRNLAMEFLVRKKLPAILHEPGEIYVETSHLTCKGFLEPLLDLGIVPDLVIHRRSLRDVSLSMLKLGTIPGRSEKGLRFYLSPADPWVLDLEDWERLHDYQLCFWYCLEIERRAQYYSKLFNEHGAKIAETTLPELKTFDGLIKCYSKLGLEVKFPIWLTKLRFLRSTGVKVNESKENKKDVLVPEDIGGLEQEVIRRIDHQELQNWYLNQQCETS